ncbi:MAG: hypothetical protein HQM09_09480 [Candidatus Riflebacteria bacterium]|nr:hypothetical protein [Candidatus Riflebacteria bacterium]
MRLLRSRTLVLGFLFLSAFSTVLSGATMQIFTTQDGFFGKKITSFAACKTRLAAGTNNGVAIYDGKICLWTPLQLPEEIASSPIKDIVFDSGGNLWIASQKGLGHYQPENKIIQVYGISDGLPNLDVERVQAFEKEVVIGCFGGFIARASLPGVTGKTHFLPVNYSSKESLKVDEITGLSFTDTTHGWLSTKGAGLIFIEDGKEGRIDKKQGLASDRVDSVLFFRNPNNGQEQILIGVSGGLSLFRERLAVEKNVFPQPDTLITSIVIGKSIFESEKKSSDALTSFIGSDNVLWVGTRSSGLWRFFNGKWTNFSLTNSGFPSNNVNRLYRTGTHIAVCTDGGLIIISENAYGYNEFRNNAFEIRNFKTFSPIAGNAPVSQIVVSDDIWVANKDGLARYVRRKGLTEDTILDDIDLAVSKEGLTKPTDETNNKLLNARGKTWEHYNKDAGNLPVDNVYRIAVDKNQSLWMIVGDSSHKKSLARLRFSQNLGTIGKAVFEIIPEDKSPWNSGTDLTALMAEGKNLFIGTRTDGFYILKNGLSASDFSEFEWEHYGPIENLPFLDIVGFARPLHPGKKAPLAILHSNALSYWNGSGFSVSQLAVDGQFSCITADGAGDLWIGSNKGLFRLSGEGDIYLYTRTNANFASNNITALIGGQNSSGQTAIWVACDENPEGSDSPPVILSFNKLEQKVQDNVPLKPVEKKFYEYVHSTGKKLSANQSDEYAQVETPPESPASINYFDGLFWDKYDAGGVRCFAVNGDYLWMGTNVRLRRFFLPFTQQNSLLQ